MVAKSTINGLDQSKTVALESKSHYFDIHMDILNYVSGFVNDSIERISLIKLKLHTYHNKMGNNMANVILNQMIIKKRNIIALGQKS